MGIRTIALIVTPQKAGTRLDQFLAAELPEKLGFALSNSSIRKMIMAGAVKTQGKPVRAPGTLLCKNQQVVVLADLSRLKPSESPVCRNFVASEAILYEDEHLIVVAKPPDLPTHPTLDPNRANLLAEIKKFLSERDGMADPYLGTHQRLDKDTSGVILFTRDAAVNASIASQFETHQVRKIYQALTHPAFRNLPSSPWESKSYIDRVKIKGKEARYASVKSGGNFAHTHFHILEQCPGLVWVQAEPLTGRPHQIRVHLSEQGLPILGDLAYGYSPARFIHRNLVTRVMLHAAEIRLTHPITKESLVVTSALPEDFRKVLQKAGSRLVEPLQR